MNRNMFTADLIPEFAEQTEWRSIFLRSESIRRYEAFDARKLEHWHRCCCMASTVCEGRTPSPRDQSQGCNKEQQIVSYWQDARQRSAHRDDLSPHRSDHSRERMRHRCRPIPTILLLSVLHACTNPSEPISAVQVAHKAQPPAAELGSGIQQAIAYSYELTGGNLDIGPDVLALCPKAKHPRFVNDTSRSLRAFEQKLVSIAECMRSGRMKGESLALTGHSEQGGDPNYRLALGARRADTVRYALVRLDVPENRIHVSSSDEMEAAGRDAGNSKQQRRVNIELADP